MTSLSRRRFLRGVAAMPLALWVARNARAEVPRVRYDLASPAGQAMLGIFADAVGRMRLRGEADPLGWTWQWYTHFVNGATTKADEIARIFGSATTPLGALASETWNTCQSHAGQNAAHFLPWHRMFVFFFEQIVREVSGRADFTLPYWNYTSYDPAQRGVVPAPFRMSGDPLFGSLYRAERTSLANAGQPIHMNQPGDAMDVAPAMACTNYNTVNSVPGFCRSIDSGIHSRIHVLVGNGRNMGAVPYAANDPLFWVHHVNIDRLWASWNRNGGPNPTTGTWLTREFAFVDGKGQRVTGRLKDFFDIDALGYTYDKWVAPDGTETALPPAQARALLAQLAAPVGAVAEVIARAIASAELGAAPVRVALSPLAAVASTLRAAAAGLDPTGARRSYLVVRGLHAWKQPEVLYHLYLTPGRSGQLGPKTYVGNINFFDAEFHDHGGGALGDALGENFYSFDVTALLRRLARSGALGLGTPLAVTFVPGGKPAPGAKPLVGTVELVWQ
ncbi:tyrosinase family protein [Vulcaniibacterium tengchongense]|uniref:Polyphenol oxidase-like protein n=1 Tax=Vulcaniibacterium tengchongense TaxID=1273429 RepID=A0A3N4VF60_9GAMM|nr:tyrosinase family protein [Vulcaniibacterium tengchongense]RPE81666.1 polyphenol oxidase-like protein [Vulcaniibacterium tengchongense]